MTTDTPTAGDQTTSFTDLGVHDDLVAALAENDIEQPFPIQELTLPMGLGGADIIGQARTGTGKTLAFGLPLLQRVDLDDGRTQALVIVPTRELCLQVRDDLSSAGTRKGVDVVAAYGGRPIEPQAKAIEGGAHVVIGTPGRLLDLCARGHLDLSTVTGVVLDEADEMLDLGFLPDVERLIEATATPRQTLLFSATMPPAVVGLARRYMSKPTFLRADVEEPDVSTKTKQYFFSCHKLDKPAVMARILSAPNRGLTVVFTRTKRMADILAKDLSEQGIAAAPIHSDLRQEARERTLKKFRSGTIDTLIATEVAARGLDIDDVTHVVNYDCPDDEKMYLHRIGRTGRAGSSGVAITLAMWNESARLEMIKRALDITDETHEVFSTSPILVELFDLPPKKANSGKGSAKRRSKSKKGGGPSGRSRTTATGDAGTSESSEAVASEGQKRSDGDDDDARPAGRARRRARRDAINGVDSTRTKLTEHGHAKPDDDDSDSDQPATRRRVRTRTRTVTHSPQPAGSKPTTDGASADEPSTSSRRRTRNRTQKPPERADSKGEAQKARSGGTEDDEQNAQGGQRTSGNAKRRNERGRSNRGRGGSRRNNKRGPSNGGGSAKPRIDKDALRGNGQPRLRRPMEVEHLP